MRVNRFELCLGALSGIGFIACTTASAQYATGFENVNASAGGTVLTGQDGYYLPNATSVDFLATTYAANFMGINANPDGGDNFIVATGPGAGVYGRAQRDMAYGDNTGSWTIAFDVYPTYVGAAGANGQNIGSISLQPFPGSQDFIALARWTALGDDTMWNADYVWFSAAGAQLTEAVADAGFQNLPTNRWYRWSTTFNLDTNAIEEVSITDLTTGTGAMHNPIDKYLEGGSAGGMPAPSGFRFFAGGAAIGNALGFDNLDIAEAGGCDADCDGNGTLNTLDFLCFLNLFSAGDIGADFNGDGTVNTLDFLAFLNAFAAGCE